MINFLLRPMVPVILPGVGQKIDSILSELGCDVEWVSETLISVSGLKEESVVIFLALVSTSFDLDFEFFLHPREPLDVVQFMDACGVETHGL